MKNITVFAVALFFAFGIAYSQDKTALHYASLIDSANLKTTLAKLASDEFEGRGTAEKGGELTINYIAGYLKSKNVPAGNKGSYFQNIGAKQRNGREKSFLLDNFDYREDYSYNNTMLQDTLIKTDEILFVGYGIYSSTYNDYENMDITGKVIMRFTESPTNRFGLNYAINPSVDEYIKSKKPKAMLLIQPNFRTFSNSFYARTIFEQDKETIPEITVNERLANKILSPTGKTVKQIAYEVEQSGQSPSVAIHRTVSFCGNLAYRDARANNVIGLIEGSDLKDEYIVLSAHHDHQGKPYNTIYNGADDNASGVSAVMEIAAMLAKAKKEGKGPRRSVVVLFPAAEEHGLYGSKFYVDNPVFPLAKTVACINIDMVGRVSYDYEGKGNNYVYVTNHNEMSGNLTQWVEKVNSNSTQLTLDLKYTSPGDSDRHFYRSDQYNFAKAGIPSIMLTSGEHKDYHKSTDDYELIDFNGAWKRTKLAFLLVWELANTAQVKSLP